MNIALSHDTRRRRFDNVIVADARVVDRRQEWKQRRDALESEQVREQYIAQSRFRSDYALAEMLDGQEPELQF